VPIETLHFLIIAIQKRATRAFVYMYCSRLYVYVASITPINTLITFRGVRCTMLPDGRGKGV